MEEWKHGWMNGRMNLFLPNVSSSAIVLESTNRTGSHVVNTGWNNKENRRLTFKCTLRQQYIFNKTWNGLLAEEVW